MEPTPTALYRRFKRAVPSRPATNHDPRDGSENERLASRLTVAELPVENRQVREVIAEIDEIPRHGGALLRKFRILDEDEVFESIRQSSSTTIKGVLESGGFLHEFLCSEELNESIDGLNTQNGFSGYHWSGSYDDPRVRNREQGFEWCHSLFVDGYLAWVLVRGGAYRAFEGSHAEAKQLGRQFERAVVGDRYESVHAWRIEDQQWSEWFEGTIHWDETLLLVDESEKLLWLFMFTATD